MTIKAPRVLVVGGGLSGLATAWFLRRDHPDWHVEVRESSDRLGGKLHTGVLAGQPFDLGADAFLNRQPEFAGLCEELGLGHDLVAPATSKVWLWIGDNLRALPSGTVLGIPSDLDAVEASGVLSPAGLARARAEATMAPPQLQGSDDPAVADLVADRFGHEVVDRLVDPLLSGIYAGDTRRLGLRSAAPALASLVDEAVRRGESLTAVAARRVAAGAQRTDPVFKTVRQGLGAVIDRLAEGGLVQSSRPVSRLGRSADGWSCDGEHFDAVVLAVSAPAAAAILADVAGDLATTLREITYADVTVVALAFPGEVELPEGSGMLVPRDEGHLVKAATWSSRKWPHLADRDAVVLRCSTGRVDDDRHLTMQDDALVAAVREELRVAMDLDAACIDAVVQRWPAALAQYDTGHAVRVVQAQGQAAEHPGLVLTGAAYDGVGLPACVRQASSAAGAVALGLGA